MSERRLDLRFEDLSDALSDVKQLQSCGYEKTGQWNLAQIVDHLNHALRMTIDGPPFMMPWFLRPLLRVAFMPIIRRGRPTKLRGKAPPPLVPAESPDESEVILEFEKLVTRLLDPKTTFIDVHPVMGKLNREQWLLMQQWHCAHHLSFLVPRDSKAE